MNHVGWEGRSMSVMEDVTWRFEFRLGNQEWVPITKDLINPDDLDLVAGERLAGVHESPETWREAPEAALIELNEMLPELTMFGDPLGMTGARILVWEGIGTQGPPACAVEATNEQLANGRVMLAQRRVAHAQRDVELARAQLRAQLVKAVFHDRIGRNAAARLANGALSRRLVLALLAGRDLVDAVGEALTRSGRWDKRWYPPGGFFDWDDEHGFRETHLGPFFYGPVRLNLSSDGYVSMCLVDIDGPNPWETPEYHLQDDELETFLQERRQRARGYAEAVLPLLTAAGFTVRESRYGFEAKLDDLVSTIEDHGPWLQVADAS